MGIFSKRKKTRKPGVTVRKEDREERMRMVHKQWRRRLTKNSDLEKDIGEKEVQKQHLLSRVQVNHDRAVDQLTKSWIYSLW